MTCEAKSHTHEADVVLIYGSGTFFLAKACAEFALSRMTDKRFTMRSLDTVQHEFLYNAISKPPVVAKFT